MLPPPSPTELAELADKARAFNLIAHPKPTPRAPNRNLRRRLSPETVVELARRYEAGEHTTALSKEYGISRSGLISLLRSEEVTLRRRPLSTTATERAIQLYEEGLTIQQVSAQVDASYGTIRKMLHRKGVEVRGTCVTKSRKTLFSGPSGSSQSAVPVHAIAETKAVAQSFL